jgi:hypothetical protein
VGYIAPQFDEKSFLLLCSFVYSKYITQIAKCIEIAVLRILPSIIPSELLVAFMPVSAIAVAAEEEEESLPSKKMLG